MRSGQEYIYDTRQCAALGCARCNATEIKEVYQYAIDQQRKLTEHGVCGIDEDENIYIVDWWSGQTTADKWIDSGLDLVEIYKPMMWVGEAGPIRRSIEPFLAKRSEERKVYAHLHWTTRTKDKQTTARAFQARASMKKVYLPRTQWAYDLLQQLLSFPAGKHDDKVDVCALFGLMVQDMVSGKGPAMARKKPKRDRWDRAFEEDDEQFNWKVC